MKDESKKRQSKKNQLILVTGMSGAGLGTSIKALADIGFYCIDNLPFEMILQTLELLNQKPIPKEGGVAFGVHIQSFLHAQEFKNLKKTLKNIADVTVIFLTADEETLLTRFSTNRRRHPLLPLSGKLLDSIKMERKILEQAEWEADVVIDTTGLTSQNLGRIIESQFLNEVSLRKLFVTIVTFGFKHGQYRPLDSLFDVRFLKNPFFVPELRNKTGLDKEVREFLLNEPSTQELLDRLFDWHQWVLPKYYEEGKHYYRVGIGCTGGKHRSVGVAEELSKRLQNQPIPGVVVNTTHRDLLQGDQ